MNDDKVFKRCSGICAEILEVNKSNFEWRNDAKKWRDQCRKCMGKGHVIIENNTKYQYCTGECGLKLEINKENFDIYIYKNKEYYYKQCITCSLNKRKQFREDNKDKIKEQKAEEYQNNKEKIKTRSNKRYQENKEEILKKEKIRRDKPENKAKERERNKNKRKSLKNKIHHLVSGSVLYNMKSRGLKKEGSIKKHLPFSIEELIIHIEKQFLEPGNEWMTWDNHGVYYRNIWKDDDITTWTWQLDHIKPHSRFNYTSMEDEEFKKCWALSNLRPYPSKWNVSEGNRR